MKNNRRQIYRLAIDFATEQSMLDFITRRLNPGVRARPLDWLDGADDTQAVHSFIAEPENGRRRGYRSASAKTGAVT